MIAVVVAGVGILLFMVGPIRARTLGKLDQLSVGGLSFTISNRRRFSDSLALAGLGTTLGEHAAHFTAEPGVTADLHGIHFWDNNPPVHVGMIAWGRVSDIRIDAPTGSNPFSRFAIDLAVEVERSIITLSLVSPNSTRRMRSFRRDGDAIVRDLRQLQAAAIA
jgi:hypothetical protein